MKVNIELFQSVLDKYRLVWGSPGEFRKYILKTRKKKLIESLKLTGTYSVPYDAVLSLNLALRKAGLRITIAQSKAAALALSMALAAALGAAAYMTLNAAGSVAPQVGINTPEKSNRIPFKENIADNQNVNRTGVDKVAVHDRPGFRIGVETFQGPDPEASMKITGRFAAELEKAAGSEKIQLLARRRFDKSINFILSGSVIDVDGQYMISVKLINIENSKIIYMTNGECNSQEKINSFCLKHAVEISKKLMK